MKTKPQPVYRTYQEISYTNISIRKKERKKKMAKSSRASSRKANNQRLKANVFGPVEAARAERLSAKLLELAAQPKPKPEEMKIADDEEGDDNKKGEHDGELPPPHKISP